jgi:hypothetical protein
MHFTVNHCLIIGCDMIKYFFPHVDFGKNIQKRTTVQPPAQAINHYVVLTCSLKKKCQ